MGRDHISITMRTKKRLAIIGTVGLPARYGGFETLAEKLVLALGDHYDITVYCSGKRYGKRDRKERFAKARLKYLPLDANGVQSIPYDALSIGHAMFTSDVLLVLGVAGGFMLPLVRWFTRKRIIVSIDGIEWKRAKWNTAARLFLWWSERLAVRYSHADISDNESIQDYTAQRYNRLSRVIEYGGDHTVHAAITTADRERYAFLRAPYAFKVARIEPENNVNMVLEAFAGMPDRTLVVVGNWARSEHGRWLRERFKDRSNLVLLDPIYDQRELDVLRGHCSVYVHGHSAGGTNPSLVEAMGLGRAVLAYNVAYNVTTTEGRAKYFNDAEELRQHILRTAPQEWMDIGTNMRAIAERRYTWRTIAARYRHLIERVVEMEKPRVRPLLTGNERALLQQVGASHLMHGQPFYIER
jgi:glycosyltransferase involved in cell wall biosynthesis